MEAHTAKSIGTGRARIISGDGKEIFYNRCICSQAARRRWKRFKEGCIMFINDCQMEKIPHIFIRNNCSGSTSQVERGEERGTRRIRRIP